MKNYYEILEVNKKASKEVIEKAYKVLAKKYHPDHYIGEKHIYAEQKMKEINEAYRVLSDDFLKEQYDGELEKEIEDFYHQKYQNSRIKGYEENFQNSQVNNHTQNNQTTQNRQRGQNMQYSQEKQPFQKMTKEEKREYRRKMSTISGAIELTKELYANRPKVEEIKKMTKKDAFAIGLTIIVVLLMGVILWFIPFTNGFIRELLFENPLFNWIGGLFSK